MNEEQRKIEEKELDTQQGAELKRLIRSKLAAEDFTLEKLANELNAKYPVKESKPNLSNKLIRGSLRYIDVQRIFDVLGYSIEIKKHDK